jgi:hypothetical protein
MCACVSSLRVGRMALPVPHVFGPVDRLLASNSALASELTSFRYAPIAWSEHVHSASRASSHIGIRAVDGAAGVRLQAKFKAATL